jgi:VWFA-related protein
MRRLLIAALPLSLLALALSVPATAQPEGKSPYKIEFNSDDVERLDRDEHGREGVYVQVKFTISLDSKDVKEIDGDYKVYIEENGKRVGVVDLPRPTMATDLSVILAMDTSGSMKEHNRIAMARKAADTFLGKLPTQADCGLVLFDHEVRKALPPILDRKPILNEILAVAPRGGTAFRDAALASVQMLAAAPKGRDRALVLMTDGADVNSTRSLDEVIAEARQHRVRIYTIGIGTPGTLEQVNTALVLDRSGSMELPADDSDLTTPKIKALHTAAAAFIHMMSETGRVSLISFSSRVEAPRAFTSNKTSLKKHITDLTPGGETAMLDAVYTGIAALEADGTTGRRAVVAMTDGIDNSSRRRVEEVIERAREAKIKLYMLGFGRKNEIDHATMQRMADETDGKYYHARNKDSLVEIFEGLSIELHDDGIDEASLTRLARETGGACYPAQDVSKLQLVLEQVSESIQRAERKIVFRSLNQRKGGELRRVALRLVHGSDEGSGELVGTGGYQTHGLVIAEMHPMVYLGLLAFLLGLIIVPAALRRPARAGM